MEPAEWPDARNEKLVHPACEADDERSSRFPFPRLTDWIMVWYLGGRLRGPPPTSISLLPLAESTELKRPLFFASSLVSIRLGVDEETDAGLIRGSASMLSSGGNNWSTKRIRYSVTTAWTPIRCKAATPSWKSKSLQRSRFGAQTMATFLGVIPVCSPCEATALRCRIRYSSVR